MKGKADLKTNKKIKNYVDVLFVKVPITFPISSHLPQICKTDMSC